MTKQDGNRQCMCRYGVERETELLEIEYDELVHEVGLDATEAQRLHEKLQDPHSPAKSRKEEAIQLSTAAEIRLRQGGGDCCEVTALIVCSTFSNSQGRLQIACTATQALPKHHLPS